MPSQPPRIKRRFYPAILFFEGVIALGLLVVFVLLVFPLDLPEPVDLTPISYLVELTATRLELGASQTAAHPWVTLASTVMPTQAPNFTPTTIPSPSPAPVVPQGRIVFTCTPEEYNQLCMIDASGRGYIRLTNRRNHDYYPSFSPRGDRIFFSSNQTGAFEVFTLYLADRTELQVTKEVGNATAPELSVQGEWIVFANKWFDDSSIWVVRPDGSQAHSLTDQEWNEIDPAWSPDGRRIAFAGVRGGFVELFIMDADGSHIQQVTHGVSRIGGRSSWSLDGERLVYYAGPRGDRDIYVVEIASGKSIRLTEGGNNTGPCFSPDGNWIVFSSSRLGDYEIYIMRSDGTGVRQLTDNDFDDWQPRWGT